MRFIFPKTDTFEELVFLSEQFFSSNNIDTTKISSAIYNELFKSLLVNALYFVVEWKSVDEDEIEKVLAWTIANKRMVRDDAAYYEYSKADEYMSLSVARLKVRISNLISTTFKSDEEKESFLDHLMGYYYFHVLDVIDLQIKNLLLSTLGNGWNILEVVETKRTLEIVDYDDFRINAWQMYRSKESE